MSRVIVAPTGPIPEMDTVDSVTVEPFFGEVIANRTLGDGATTSSGVCVGLSVCRGVVVTAGLPDRSEGSGRTDGGTVAAIDAVAAAATLGGVPSAAEGDQPATAAPASATVMLAATNSSARIRRGIRA